MNKLRGGVIFAAILGVGLLFAVFCTSIIPGGYVGAIYSLKGGISDEIVSAGLEFIKPTERVIRYSIATEQLVLTADERDGSETNESFDATCKDGILNVDLEMSYRFEEENIPMIAKKYRGKSGEEIVETIVKQKVKTYVNEVTSEYTVLEAYMDKKSELNADLTKHLSERLKPFAIEVESATIPRAEPNKAIKKAITERSKKAQEVEAAKLEQEKQKILAATKKIEAQGEADAAIAKAEGEAKANKLISDSMTKELLEKMEMEARIKHGWVTVEGAGNTIVDNR